MKVKFVEKKHKDMTGNEADDGKEDEYDLENYERSGGKEMHEQKQQVEDREVGNVNTASKVSKVSSLCLLILGVTILVLLGVGVASAEDNGQGAVGEEANPECTPTTESTEGTS